MNKLPLICCLLLTFGCATQVEQTTLTEPTPKLVKVNGYKPPEKRSKILEPGKPMRPQSATTEVARADNTVITSKPEQTIDGQSTDEQARVEVKTPVDTASATDKAEEKKKCSGQEEPNPCPNEATKEWLQSVDNTYKQLLEVLSPPQRDRLINSQNNWQTFYDAEKEFIYQLLVKDNTFDLSIYHSYVEELAKTRAQDLLRYSVNSK